MSGIAIDDKTGEVMVMDGSQWVRPKIAENADGARVFLHQGEWKPVPSASPAQPRDPMRAPDALVRKVTDMGDNVARSIGRGLTGGALDEVLAALKASSVIPTPIRDASGNYSVNEQPIAGAAGDSLGARYDANLANERSRNRAYDAEHPAQSLVAQGVGAVLGPGKVLGAIKPAASFVGRLGQAAATGAGLGGASGFASGEGGFENRARDAGIGAAIGGVAGPVMQAAGEGLGALYRGARNMFAGPKSSEDQASSLISRAMERDRTTPSQIAESVLEQRARGVPADIVDVAGENTRALARSAASAPGPARNMGRDFTDRRMDATYNATDSALLKAFNPEDFADAQRKTIDRLTKNAREAYGDIWKTADPVRSPLIDKILDTPAGQAAMRDVLRRVEPGQRSALGPVGKDGAVESYYPETLHRIKVELATGAQNQTPNKLTGGNRSEQTYLESLSRKLADELKMRVPGYANAAKEYSDDAALIDAGKLGADRFFKMRPTELKRQIDDMGPAEREMFLNGAYDAIQRRVIDQTRTTANFAAKVTDIPGVRERLAAVLPNDRYAAMMKSLDDVSSMYGNTTFIGSRSGSQTQPRLADAEDAAGLSHMGHAAVNALRGRPLDVAANVFNAARDKFGRVADRTRGIDEATAERIAGLLLSNRPDVTQLQGLLSSAATRGASSLEQEQARRAMLLQYGAIPGLLAVQARSR